MRRLVVSVLLASVALGGAACSSGGSSANSGFTTLPSPPAATPIVASSVVINGKSVSVPREEYRPDRPIQQETDQGQQIIISPKGLLPIELYAPAPCTITWTNLTAKTVTLQLSVFGTPLQSPAIGPGASYSKSFDTEGSIGYITSTGLHGSVGIAQLPLAAIPQK
jgi:hypothetical protein